MKLKLLNSVGLHARPALLFVKTAQDFQAEIMVRSGDTQVSAKSLMSLLALGAGNGAEISVEADGADAEEALIAIKELVETNFGELS